MALITYDSCHSTLTSTEQACTLAAALEGNMSIQHFIIYTPPGPAHDRIKYLLERNRTIAQQGFADTKPASHA